MTVSKNQMNNGGNNKLVTTWLFLCSFMVLLIIMIGGYTRLEGAGLSIVEWKPLSGVFLPQDSQEWQEELRHYQQSPEYQKKNYAISMEEFKRIYLIEYIHRLIGRIAGIIFLIPFLYFCASNRFSSRDVKDLLLIFCLGALQGFLGWYMVKSGLYDRPEVSQYRLVAHLLTAIIIYSLLVWKGLSLRKSDSKHVLIKTNKNVNNKFLLLAIFVIFQVALGGFLAGLKGGMIYNSFPLMDGEIVPTGLFLLNPWYINFFDNIALIQFLHRITAFFIVIYTLYLYAAVRSLQLKFLQNYMHILMLLVFFQFILGVLTLINFVPTHLALGHQMLAIILITNLLLILHRLTYNNSQK